MNFDIRLAVQADAAALSALILRTIRTTNAADYAAEEIAFACASFTAEKLAEKIAARDVFMLFSDGALAGTASYAAGILHSLFIDPSCQAKGFGALMLAHVERHALAQGADRLALSSSVSAKGFYEAFGFHVVEDEFSSGGTTHLMHKRL
jgi:GNAT superfamily N-acetyltransferase